MSYPLHRYEALGDLSAAERSILLELGDPEVTIRKGQVIHSEGDKVRGFHLHISGWISSSVMLGNGNRTIQKVHLPGDMLGTPSMVLPRAADTLRAITEATISCVPYKRFGALFSTVPRLAALFMVGAQMERLCLMDALAVKGRASAKEQMAHLLVDLYNRLVPLGLVIDNRFYFPLTQGDIGDILGLTSVHVNRVLRMMDEEDLIAREYQHITLVNLEGLKSLCPMPPRKPGHNLVWLPECVEVPAS